MRKFSHGCLEPEFERIMKELAAISCRFFRAFARLPTNFVVSNDNIVLSTGPVVSTDRMHKHIFPRYEEFRSMVKNSGKEVMLMVGGNIDAFVDDMMGCGARGIIT